MSSASTHGRRRRPAGEGVGRYYRSLDPCLCPWGEMPQKNLVTFLTKTSERKILKWP